ncbi:MAG: hypothetical protein K8J08_05560 [Thermoanaerobaculia bacterium]|nr:hypothetical protein [Thermoanaerobaculia bacterium]
MSTAPARFWRSKFWQRWLLANALGEFIGLGVVAGSGFLLFQFFGEPTGAAQTFAISRALVGLGAFEGLVLGLAQRHVLRTRLPKIHGWVRATVAGAIVAWTVGMVPLVKNRAVFVTQL